MIFINYKKKLSILSFLILLFLCVMIQKSDNKNIENKLNRYIKYKSKCKLKYYDFEKELPAIKNYLKLLKENYFKIKEYKLKTDKPKVSFIASVYNKEKYLSRFISSIQNQDLQDYELIIVDDYSNDKSTEVIDKFKNKDYRMQLIENKKNMGSLYTRYIGSLYSKGEYIIFLDSDDIILKEGILKAYNHIKRKKLDMIEFHSVFEMNESFIYISRRYYKYSDIIYQPILSYIYYFRDNEGVELNTALWDKLIKKESVLKSFSYIGENNINKKIFVENDVVILFALFKNSNSFQYIDELGYYHFFNNNDSITNTRYEPKNANRIIYSIFYNIKILFEITENTFLDKLFSVFKLEQGYNTYKICLKYMNSEYKLIKIVLNEFLDSKYISLNHKKIIKNIKKEIFS